jgi:threonine dehydratase
VVSSAADTFADAALAALLQERQRQASKRVAVVLSGANVDRERYAQVLAGTEKS